MYVLGGEGTVYVEKNDITHFTTWKRELFLHTILNKTYTVPTTLGQLLKVYPQFFDAHRSYIINVNRAIGISDERKGVFFDKDEKGNVSQIREESIKPFFELLQDRPKGLKGEIRVLDHNDEMKLLDIDEVGFFYLHHREISVFTAFESYTYPVDINGLQLAFAKDDFVWSDRSCVVDRNKVSGYSKERKGLFFGNDEDSSMIAPVSKPFNYKKIIEYLKSKGLDPRTG